MNKTLKVKAIIAGIALIVSTGVFSGLYFFYEKNAWAQDVVEASQKQRRTSDFIALDVVKLKIYRWNRVKERQGGRLTDDQEDELTVLRVERKLLLEAIATAQK